MAVVKGTPLLYSVSTEFVPVAGSTESNSWTFEINPDVPPPLTPPIVRSSEPVGIDCDKLLELSNLPLTYS